MKEALQVTDGGLRSHEYWRLVTYVLPQENGWPHLAVNMFTLYLYGWQLERLVGRTRFALVYFGSGALGMVLLANVRPINAATGLRSGASLATFGVVGALAMMYLIRSIAGADDVARIAAVLTALISVAALIGSAGTPGVVNGGVDGAIYAAANHALGVIAGLVLGVVSLLGWHITTRDRRPAQ